MYAPTITTPSFLSKVSFVLQNMKAITLATNTIAISISDSIITFIGEIVADTPNINNNRGGMHRGPQGGRPHGNMGGRPSGSHGSSTRMGGRR